MLGYIVRKISGLELGFHLYYELCTIMHHSDGQLFILFAENPITEGQMTQKKVA